MSKINKFPPIVCCICDYKTTTRGISAHTKYQHKLSSREYFDKYLKKENEGICLNCSSPTNYLGISKRYRNYCSDICSNHHEELNQIRTKNHKEAIKNNPEIFIKISQKLKTFYRLHPNKLKELHTNRDAILKDREKELKRKNKISITRRNFYKKLKTKENSSPYILYVVKHTTKPLIKIGITNNLKRRIKSLIKDFGDSYLIFSLVDTYNKINSLETMLHRHFNEQCKVQPSGSGRTEWFCSSITKETLSLLKEFRIS